MDHDLLSTSDRTAPKTTVTYPSDTELVITRDFPAPAELVWQALTQPEHVRRGAARFRGRRRG